jgi:tRNA(Arg) A34 adenosine deaminase TadA
MPGSDQSGSSRRFFLRSASLAATASLFTETPTLQAAPAVNPVIDPRDAKRIRDLAAWTALTFKTDNPVPFGAEIFHTKSGESLMRVANAVGPEHDPSSHAELRAIRLACKKLNAYMLTGYTLYTTCEPCPMCMGCILWAGLDRMVYGATIADAARIGHQIMIPAAEVAKRSDIKCVVDGPIEREACLALFTNPVMLKALEKWKAEGNL